MRWPLEIHIPISPTPSFFRQIHYLAASLRLAEGAGSAARLVVTVGDDCEPFDLSARLPWASRHGVEFRWVPRHLYQEFGYFATALERYRYEYQAPLVLMLDADIVVARPFSELLDLARVSPAVYGMIAHSSPWMNSGLLHLRSEEEWWQAVFKTAGLSVPAFDCEYTGYEYLYNRQAPRFTPPYFNQGVIIAPVTMVRSLGAILYNELVHANAVVLTDFRFQVAITLALIRTGTPWGILPMRYNFTPGFTAYVKEMPDEWREARFVHYTHTPQLPRELLQDDAAMESWFSTPVSGEPDLQLRAILEPVFDRVKGDVKRSWRTKHKWMGSLTHLLGPAR